MTFLFWETLFSVLEEKGTKKINKLTTMFTCVGDHLDTFLSTPTFSLWVYEQRLSEVWLRSPCCVVQVWSVEWHPCPGVVQCWFVPGTQRGADRPVLTSVVRWTSEPRCVFPLLGLKNKLSFLRQDSSPIQQSMEQGY